MWCNGSTRLLGRWRAVRIGHVGPKPSSLTATRHDEEYAGKAANLKY